MQQLLLWHGALPPLAGVMRTSLLHEGASATDARCALLPSHDLSHQCNSVQNTQHVLHLLNACRHSALQLQRD